jgi:iron complex outermembrane receptor protein
METDMKQTVRLSLLASASLLVLASAAAAQSTADLMYLGELELESGYDPSAPVPGYVATTAQTATKSGTPILETQQSVSVITGEQIEDQGATTLGDTLGFTAGVLAQPFGTDPRFDSPSIRGFSANNAQYLNGLRILRDFGAPSFEIYSLERIEVLRGPSSVLYGSGNPGGIINQVQKRAQRLSFGEVGVGVGDPKATEGFVDFNHVFSDKFSARLTTVVRDSEEDIAELETTRKYLGLATRWDVTDATVLQFLGSWQKDDPITPAGVPFDLTLTEQGKDLRDFYAGDPNDDRSDRETLNLGFELRHEFSNDWALDAGFRYQKFDWDYTGFYVDNAVPDGDTITRGGINQVEDSTTLNLDTRITGSAQTGAVTHDLLVGVDLRHYDIEDSTEFMFADPISFDNPVYNGANLTAPWFIQSNDLELEQMGIYAQDEMSLGNWRGSLALRHDWAEQSGTTFTNFAGASPVDQSDEATTYRLGLSYVTDQGVAPYLSYATSFDPEIGVDIAGNTLDPTEGKQWEVGVKYQPLGFNGFFSVALFDLEQTNLSTTVTEGGITGIRQIGTVRSQGLEIEGTVDLENGWSVRGAYTYNEAEQRRGDNPGNDLPNAPQHNASLWVSYEFANTSALDGLQLGGGVRYIGERFGDAANLFKSEDVTLLDLRAAYEITENTHFSVNVTNLTDEVYVANCGGFGCFYGDGRTVQARLTYKW